MENLKLYIEACRKRNDALDHVLLFGPPGLGKTTLAYIISRELDVNLKQTSGPVLERAADLAGLLTNLRFRDVLFIDEVHRMNNVIEEYLYSAMEDYAIDILIDRGPSARSRPPEFGAVHSYRRHHTDGQSHISHARYASVLCCASISMMWTI